MTFKGWGRTVSYPNPNNSSPPAMKGAFKLAIYWLVLAIPFTQAANLSAVANPREPKWGDDNVCEYFLSVPWYLKAENWVDSYVGMPFNMVDDCKRADFFH